MSASQNAPRLPNPVAPPARIKTPFEEFLLAEYQNVAQAHFTTIQTISEFFKQYILIVSLPISVAVVFLKPTELRSSGVADFLKKWPSIPLILSVLVVLVGLGVLGYVISLRFDAVLYARTINGIRKYFCDQSDLNVEDELRIRVLPKLTHFPRYIEPVYFFFVVVTFGFVGTAYLLAGLYYYWWATDRSIGTIYFWSLPGSCLLAHICLYYFMGGYRERGYLRGHTIGIDIDGVLNQHRLHFAEILSAQTGKSLNPDSITQIPVHRIEGCGVTAQDEGAVFNWPPYWLNMPCLEDAAETVRKIRNELGYKIWIFTDRSWPNAASFLSGHEKEYWDSWQSLSKWVRVARWQATRETATPPARRNLPGLFLRGRIMRRVTEKWLARHGFVFDKLILEKKYAYRRPKVARDDRFSSSKNKQIWVFVEDNLDNARKLADLCEIVFLIDHPYNRADTHSLPKNIIRVTSWQKIEEVLRHVS